MQKVKYSNFTLFYPSFFFSSLESKQTFASRIQSLADSFPLRFLRANDHYDHSNPTTTRNPIIGKHIRRRSEQHMDLVTETMGEVWLVRR